jgi:hypothetical protein
MTKHYTRENDQEIADLYRAGHGLIELAERFGVSTTPITRALKRQGVERRPAHKHSTWTGSDEQRADVIAAYQSGESIQKITARMKIRATVIIKTLDDAGINRWGAGFRPIFDSATVDAIVAGYQSGIKLTDLAKQYGTNHITIRNYLKRRDVKMRQPGVSQFWTDERKAEAMRRYLAGESQQQIADDFGCHQTGVCNALRGQGVAMRRAPAPRRKGGRTVDHQGYIRVLPPDEDLHLVKPHANGYVLEHRLVMARKLGRPLRKDESVHHINGDRADNREENLQLRKGKHGNGVRAVCLDCGSHNIGHEKLT